MEKRGRCEGRSGVRPRPYVGCSMLHVTGFKIRVQAHWAGRLSTVGGTHFYKGPFSHPLLRTELKWNLERGTGTESESSDITLSATCRRPQSDRVNRGRGRSGACQIASCHSAQAPPPGAGPQPAQLDPNKLLGLAPKRNTADTWLRDMAWCNGGAKSGQHSTKHHGSWRCSRTHTVARARASLTQHRGASVPEFMMDHRKASSLCSRRKFGQVVGAWWRSIKLKGSLPLCLGPSMRPRCERGGAKLAKALRTRARVEEEDARR